MRRVVLRFGLIGGAVIALLMALTLPFVETIGFDRGAIVGYTTMVLAFMVVYAGVRRYRDTVGGGTVTFGRALLVGLWITLVVTACYVATWQVLYYGFMPDFIDRYTAFSLAQARESGASDADLARQTKDLADFATLYRNPLVNIAFTFLEPLPVGLVFTLVTAGLLGRRPAAVSRDVTTTAGRRDRTAGRIG
jgi:hypothetical protein